MVSSYVSPGGIVVIYVINWTFAKRKHISAINAEFTQATDQSCLNQWFVCKQFSAMQKTKTTPLSYGPYEH